MTVRKSYLARLEGHGVHLLPTSVRLSSVHSPSRGHISKTKQDRPIVTMEQYLEIGTADSVAALRSAPPTRLPRQGGRSLLGKARLRDVSN